MDRSRLAVFAARPGEVDRKLSLNFLGGSLAVVALARPQVVDAKKKCKKQKRPCRDYWRSICLGNEQCENYF